MLLVSPKEELSPLAIKLSYECTNNVAKYEACIAGLRVALERGIRRLEVYGDSTLIIEQILGHWKINEKKLAPYRACLEKKAFRFEEVHFFHLP